MGTSTAVDGAAVGGDEVLGSSEAVDHSGSHKVSGAACEVAVGRSCRDRAHDRSR